MIVSIVVAMDEKRGIGVNSHLPWHLAADLKRFKALTMGHHLIMGRVTYQSIGYNLPGRTMIVITHQLDFHPLGVLIAHSLEKALDIARERGETEVFIIGGGVIFTQALNHAERLYLTLVHTRSPVDTYFPLIDENEWVVRESSTHQADAENEYSFTYKVLERKLHQ